MFGYAPDLSTGWKQTTVFPGRQSKPEAVSITDSEASITYFSDQPEGPMDPLTYRPSLRWYHILVLSMACMWLFWGKVPRYHLGAV